MEVDRNGLEVMERDECLRLLSTIAIGRVAVHSGALPTVLPVNFVMTPEGILVRTGPGTKLDAALRNAVVAFEADRIDPLYHAGWSVVVTGVAREVTEPSVVDEARRLPLTPWGNGAASHYVCISADIVSGRRIVSCR